MKQAFRILESLISGRRQKEAFRDHCRKHCIPVRFRLSRTRACMMPAMWRCIWRRISASSPASSFIRPGCMKLLKPTGMSWKKQTAFSFRTGCTKPVQSLQNRTFLLKKAVMLPFLQRPFLQRRRKKAGCICISILTAWDAAMKKPPCASGWMRCPGR